MPLVDDRFEERRIPEEDDLFEGRPQHRHDPQDLRREIPRAHDRDRVALRREQAAACGREQAAHPGAERECNHGEGAASVRAEGAEHLLEARAHGDLVSQRPRPDRGLARRSRRHRELLAPLEAPAAAAVGERVPRHVVPLGHQRQRAKIRERADGRRHRSRAPQGNRGTRAPTSPRRGRARGPSRRVGAKRVRAAVGRRGSR